MEQEKTVQKNEATLRQWSEAFNEAVRRTHVVNEVYNSFYNHLKIVSGFEGDPPYSFDLKNHTPHKGPCMIIGSGPTLDKSIGRIKEFNGGVICSTSQATTLVRYGVIPDYIVALDPNSSWEEIKDVPWLWGLQKTALITHPGVDPGLIAEWGGDIVLFRQNVNTTQFYTNAQRVGYSKRIGQGQFEVYIKTLLTMFSCAAAGQILIAKALGYESQYLIGCDFSCPGGQARFTQWKYEGEWKEYKSGTVEEDWAKPGQYEVYTAGGIPTMPIHLFYKKNFISAWRLDTADLYNVGDNALTEIPRTTIDEIIKKQGKKVRWCQGGGTGEPKLHIGTFGVKQRIESAENYLAVQNLYVLHGDDGFQFVECVEPENELPIYIAKHNAIKICNNCKWHGLFQPQKGMELPELDTIECPQCKQKGHLVSVKPFDLIKNIRRANKRLAHAKKWLAYYKSETTVPIPEEDMKRAPGNMSMLMTGQSMNSTETDKA